MKLKIDKNSIILSIFYFLFILYLFNIKYSNNIIKQYNFIYFILQFFTFYLVLFYLVFIQKIIALNVYIRKQDRPEIHYLSPNFKKLEKEKQKEGNNRNESKRQ